MATSKPLHLGGKTIVCIDDGVERDDDVQANSSTGRGEPTRFVIQAVSGEGIALIRLTEIRETARIMVGAPQHQEPLSTQDKGRCRTAIRGLCIPRGHTRMGERSGMSLERRT
jgi:hypothetical protein